MRDAADAAEEAGKAKEGTEEDEKARNKTREDGEPASDGVPWQLKMHEPRSVVRQRARWCWGSRRCGQRSGRGRRRSGRRRGRQGGRAEETRQGVVAQFNR